jgi:hypothetical protein
MKKIHSDGWNSGVHKDTFWNLAVLIGGALLVIASAIDLPPAPGHVSHLAYGQTSIAR